MARLWVDDLRDPENFVKSEWDWVTNYDSALKALSSNKYEEVSLDNDLGEEKEGHHIFSWIEERLYWKDVNLDKLKSIYVHSSNVEAVRSILTAREAMEGKYGIVLCVIPQRYLATKNVSGN